MQSSCLNISSVSNKKIESFLLKTQKELNAIYEESFSRLPKIFLIGSRKDLDKIRGEKTPNWLVAWTENEDIFILNPKVYEKESCHKGDFWKVLKHEYCHIYHRRITRNSYPHWLTEGTACYFAKQNKELPFEKEALSVFSNPDPTNVYNVGYFWTEILVQEFGKKKLIGFINGINHNTTPKIFSKLFKDHFRVPFSKDWGRKMVAKYLSRRKI